MPENNEGLERSTTTEDLAPVANALLGATEPLHKNALPSSAAAIDHPQDDSNLEVIYRSGAT